MVGDPTAPYTPGYKGLSILPKCQAYFPDLTMSMSNPCLFCVVSVMDQNCSISTCSLQSSRLNHHSLYTLQNTYIGYQDYRTDGLA